MGTKAFALSAIVAVSLAVTGSHPANAQSYPERLIKIVVPFPAGGPSDVAGAPRHATAVIEVGAKRHHRKSAGCRGTNRREGRGAGKPRWLHAAAGRHQPQRHRAVALSESEFRAAQRLHRGGPDRTRLQRAGGQPVRACENAAGTGAIREGKPGKLTSGSTVGIGPHICLELFRARTGTDIAFIPYKGAAPAIADLLGGQIQIGMTSKAVLLPLIREGRLRALAVTSEVRWPELPDVPTMGESGIRPISGVSTQRTARPGPNPRGHHRQAQRCDRRRAAGARDAGQHRQARFRDQEPDGAGIWGQARRGSAQLGGRRQRVRGEARLGWRLVRKHPAFRLD
jgi:Uncharacterized protein conserved in bacteria